MMKFTKEAIPPGKVWVLCLGKNGGYPRQYKEGLLYVSECGIHQPCEFPCPVRFYKTTENRQEALEFPSEEMAHEHVSSRFFGSLMRAFQINRKSISTKEGNAA